jgi:hypothetical protein
MKKSAAIVILILLFSGCGSEYAEDEAQQFNTISDADNPAFVAGRDMLAAALRYDIDRFVERNQPRLKVCFLSILDADPADELLARLEGTKLEVHKFSEWSTYFRNEDGQPVMPDRFFRISVRDARIIDSTHAEVDTQWSASGIAIPGETFALENSEGTWRVIKVRYTY